MSAVFVVTLKMKGNLLKTSDMSKYSLLLNWKKSVVRSCHGAWGTSHGSSGCIGCVALCCRQMLHLLTYSMISASMPGQ